MPKTVTIKDFSVEEILEHVEIGAIFKAKVGSKTYDVKVSSLRLRTFKRSTKCVSCGRVGTVMGLDLPSRQDKPHFNLYCVEGNKRILMTKDHIIPKSLGGKNHISNMQTMCCHCNSRKGNKMQEEYDLSINAKKNK